MEPIIVNNMKINIKRNLLNTLFWLKELIPMLLWILLLISMLKELDFFNKIIPYIENNFIGILFSDLFGSISAWNVLNSYIIVDSIWNFEENLLIITTFLVAWVTVWIVQLPAEIYFLWKKFSIIRNMISFIFAIIASYLVYFFYFL